MNLRSVFLLPFLFFALMLFGLATALVLGRQPPVADLESGDAYAKAVAIVQDEAKRRNLESPPVEPQGVKKGGFNTGQEADPEPQKVEISAAVLEALKEACSAQSPQKKKTSSIELLGFLTSIVGLIGGIVTLIIRVAKFRLENEKLTLELERLEEASEAADA